MNVAEVDVLVRPTPSAPAAQPTAKVVIPPTGARAPLLRVQNVGKRFGNFEALKDVSLDVAEGEFVCFLGPSGCGKTTLLRIIAGLERQDSGRVLAAGQDISNLPPGRRNLGILFQSYALFPNLNVRENVIYGLRNRGLARRVIEDRLAEMLRLVGLEGSERKMPSQLSGGQQQRVALARAVAPSPRLLLLDEPLSALDAKVRVQLRKKIRELQTQLGLTTIMVTHDQEEAMSMGDRVVAMNQGTVEQVGAPTDVYQRPRTLFVADFVGRLNRLNGIAQDGAVRVGVTTFPCPGDAGVAGDVVVGVRPEQLRLLPAGDLAPASAAEQRLSAQVESLEYLGALWRAVVRVPGLSNAAMSVDLPTRDLGRAPLAPGDAVMLVAPHDKLMIFRAGKVLRNDAPDPDDARRSGQTGH